MYAAAYDEEGARPRSTCSFGRLVRTVASVVPGFGLRPGSRNPVAGSCVAQDAAYDSNGWFAAWLVSRRGGTE